MIVFKTVDLFDQNTGKKIGTQKVYDHQICDYTGKKIDDYTNPNSYQTDFNDNDPCFGDGEGEKWLYEYENELAGGDADGYHHYELFGQRYYVFYVDPHDGYTEVIQEMIEDALQHIEIYSLDHLLRWSRGQMLERVIKSGQYKIEDFISE
jgi:hypothetical protein